MTTIPTYTTPLANAIALLVREGHYEVVKELIKVAQQQKQELWQHGFKAGSLTQWNTCDEVTYNFMDANSLDFLKYLFVSNVGFGGDNGGCRAYRSSDLGINGIFMRYLDSQSDPNISFDMEKYQRLVCWLFQYGAEWKQCYDNIIPSFDCAHKTYLKIKYSGWTKPKIFEAFCSTLFPSLDKPEESPKVELIATKPEPQKFTRDELIADIMKDNDSIQKFTGELYNKYDYVCFVGKKGICII